MDDHGCQEMAKRAGFECIDDERDSHGNLNEVQTWARLLPVDVREFGPTGVGAVQLTEPCTSELTLAAGRSRPT